MCEQEEVREKAGGEPDLDSLDVGGVTNASCSGLWLKRSSENLKRAQKIVIVSEVPLTTYKATLLFISRFPSQYLPRRTTCGWLGRAGMCL